MTIPSRHSRSNTVSQAQWGFGDARSWNDQAIPFRDMSLFSIRNDFQIFNPLNFYPYHLSSESHSFLVFSVDYTWSTKMVAFVGIAATTFLLTLQPGKLYYFCVSNLFTFFSLLLALAGASDILGRQMSISLPPGFNASSLQSCTSCLAVFPVLAVSLTNLLAEPRLIFFLSVELFLHPRPILPL